MPRLFLSHSGKDSVQALAFQRWLVANGWSDDDVFIDLHDIGAGERWRETLRKANKTCEAVILLASPDSIASIECQKELELAEALGKAIIPAILRDLTKDDPRLARYAERQFVDLSAQPTERMEPFEHDGRMHRVEFNAQALAAIKTRLEDLGVAPGSFVWPPKSKPNAEPYPGLCALGEDDAGIFFGREADIMNGLTKLRLVRRRGAPRLFVIQAASGAGKSSFLRAGLWPRLDRDRDFAPLAIVRPAQGILTGPDGLAYGLARWFESHGKVRTAGEIHAQLRAESAATRGSTLTGLLAEASAQCSAARRDTSPDARPPSPLIAIDQGEELFAAEDAEESARFLEVLAALLKAPPVIPSGRAERGAKEQERVDPYVLITIRADSVESLLQRVAALGLDAPEPLYLPPLSTGSYRDVILKPAEVYSKQVKRLAIDPALADQLVADATGADALPLLAFTLQQLFKLHATGGELTLAHYNAIGGMGGCVTRVLRQAQKEAGTAGGDDSLRRLVVPGLATWDPAANAAKRLVAQEAELLGSPSPLWGGDRGGGDMRGGGNGRQPVLRVHPTPNPSPSRGGGQQDRAALAPLANALVANRLLTRNRDTLEVAHEALLRREPIAGWLDQQKDALKLRDDVLKEAREWDVSRRHAMDLVRRGERLEMATKLLANPDFAAALAPARDYLAACRKVETAARRGARRTQAAIYTLMLGIIAGLVAFINQEFLKEQYVWRMTMGPSVLTAAEEREKSSKPGPDTTIKDCANGCPTMIVIPAGKFKMGTAGEEAGDEGPQHEVTIAKPFAVSRTEVTFAEYDQCVAAGACPHASDSSWGRDDRPAINVSWEDAKRYVDWLSRMTGKEYRLLTEADTVEPNV